MDLHRLAGHPLGGSAHVGLQHRGFERPIALGHQSGDGIGELSRRLDHHGHAGELHLRELKLTDGLAEHRTVQGILLRRLVGRLHDADGAGGGLEAPVLEPLHREIEAATDAGFTADEAVVGHPPAVEGDLVRVHAAVPDGVDGAALHLPAGTVLRELEAVAFGSRLGHDEEREAAVLLGPIGVGAGEQHQHVGTGAEGAPRLDAVDLPPGFTVWARAGAAATIRPPTFEPTSGSVTATPPSPTRWPALGASASSGLLCRHGRGPG